DYKDDDD
nr:Chain C, FLAG peptide [Tequatrovirus T4]